jgi:hypothetical protein
MHHDMLTQRALFCIDVMEKRVALSQHFMMHVTPPLLPTYLAHYLVNPHMQVHPLSWTSVIMATLTLSMASNGTQQPPISATTSRALISTGAGRWGQHSGCA